MNKTVLITGASSGIGKALADSLHAKDYNVIGLSRKKPKNISYDYYECDITNISDLNTICKSIIEKYSTIDILINSAGVGTGGAIEEIENKDLKWVFDVNLFGLVEIIRNTLPALKQSKSAKIINIGSVAGEITIPYQTSYSMSKSALQRLSEGLRYELKQFNIEVTTVLPGDTRTGFTSNRKTILKTDSPYYENVNRSIKKMESDEQNGVSPQKVVRVIEKLLKQKKLPVKKIVGLDYKILVFLSKILPKRLVELIVRKMYG